MIKILFFSILIFIGGCGSVSTEPAGEMPPTQQSDQNQNTHIPSSNTAQKKEERKAISAGDNQQVLEGKDVVLSASKLDKTKVFTKFVWKEDSVILSESKECILEALEVGVHEIVLEAIDENGTVFTDTVTVVIKTPETENRLPLATDLHFFIAEDSVFHGALSGSDADGNPLKYLLVSLPEHGVLSGSAAHLSYTPDANFYGEDKFYFKTNDGTIDSDVATVSITVESRNDAPVARELHVQTDEDKALSITLEADDIEKDALTFSLVTLPQHGSIEISGQHAIYMPEPGFSGHDSFDYKANDGDSDSQRATVSITVRHINHAPVVIDTSVQINEDTLLELVLEGSDSDSDALIFNLASSPSLGNAYIDGNLLYYTPNSNISGTDTFQYQASDGTINSDPATITINIVPQNDAPVAENLLLDTQEDIDKILQLQASDIEGDSLTYSIVQSPSHGSVAITGNEVRYMPDTYYHGDDSFSYRAHDGNAYSAPATVVVHIVSVNNLPQLFDQSYSTMENSPIDITLEASDIENDPLTFYYDNPSNGVLSGSGKNLTYTPNQDFTGTDSFQYWANDTYGDSLKQTVTLNVISIPNTPPVANDKNITLQEDSSSVITLTATDNEDTTLTYMVQSGPLHGTISQSVDQITYIPDTNFNGTDSFTYIANDSKADSNIATVNLQIDSVNDKPEAVSQTLSVNEDQNLTLTLGGVDIDQDNLEDFTITTEPGSGIVTCTGAVCTYQPNSNFFGLDTLSFTVSDGTVNSDPAIITINVVAQNDAPVANSQSITLAEDTNATITLDANDIENDTLSYTLVTQPSHGNVILNGNTVLYTPAANYHGMDSFSFKTNDGATDSNTAIVDLTINAINDTPTAQNLSITLDEDTSTSVTLAGNDIDGDTISYTVNSNPLHGTLSGMVPNLTYTPETNYHGVDSFAYIVSDGSLSSVEATVNILINPVNDAPVADAGADLNVTEGETVTLDGSASSDVEGEIASYIWKEGTTSLGSGMSLDLSSLSVGSHTITLTVTDDGGLSATDTLTVTVNAVSLSFTKHVVLNSMVKPEGVYCADLDADGYLDILTVDSGTGDNRWLHNNRDKSFDTTKPYVATNNAWTESVFAADIDGDGDLDIVPGGYGSGTSPILAWYENNGTDDFSTQHVVDVSVADAAYVEASDLDEDGDVDFLVGSWSDNNQNGSVAWYENDGNQNFTEHIIVNNRKHMHELKAIDIDKDGDLDIVVAEYGAGRVAWFENDGSENFTEHQLATSTPNVYAVAVADIDYDGYWDIISSPDGNGQLFWFQNNHDRTFTAHQLSIGATANTYGDVDAGDIDHDGDIDILYSAYEAGELAWFKNNGDGTFIKVTIASDVNKPSSVHVADIDYDGDLDFAVALFGDKEFAWYENGVFNGPGYTLLPKTGITASIAQGDDGDTQLGSMTSFTRESSVDIVIDHVSGLMWEDDSYVAELQRYQSSAEDHCQNLLLGGYEDWRIPEIHELYYLLDRAHSPAINDLFTNIPNDTAGYWTEKLDSENYPWIGFQNAESDIASIYTFPKKYVRCVRGERFKLYLKRDNSAQTVNDYRHHLEWQDDTTVTSNGQSWSEALNYCKNLSLNGGGWRLPNINELFATVDIYRSPATQSTFVNGSADLYWSSTAEATNIVAIDFSTGMDTIVSETGSYKVRCVRDVL